jgi:hypothetical protein
VHLLHQFLSQPSLHNQNRLHRQNRSQYLRYHHRYHYHFHQYLFQNLHHLQDLDFQFRRLHQNQ